MMIYSILFVLSRFTFFKVVQLTYSKGDVNGAWNSPSPDILIVSNWTAIERLHSSKSV